MVESPVALKKQSIAVGQYQASEPSVPKIVFGSPLRALFCLFCFLVYLYEAA